MNQNIPLKPTSSKPLVEFGMLYDKFTFAKLVRRLIQNYGIRSICEYPANDLLGNNSEEFERLGCNVERLTTRIRIDKKYDLVWNFCEFENRGNPSNFVQDVASLSNKYILIVTQNKNNVIMFHRLYHIVKGKEWDHGFIEYMSSSSVSKALGDHGNLKVVETGAFDVPWFILDFYESGSFFRRLTPKSLLNTQEMKESIFENSPLAIKSLLAHHHYALCQVP